MNFLTGILLEIRGAMMFNTIISGLLYWAPVSVCVFWYTARTGRNYQKDLRARREEQYYMPTDTVGDIIGRAFVSLMPIANLWAALFDVSPEMFGKFFRYLDKLFSQPLVPKRREQK